MKPLPEPNMSTPRALVVIGCGNIGSQVVPLLASLAIERVDLIDPDRYEAGNRGYQHFAPGDVGRPKALVQARRLRALRPDITVEAHICRFEDMPLGRLSGRMLLACVDSRAARQAINRAAFALGVPWIDAALGREGSVRARGYVPGVSAACMQCAWDAGDYALLEQKAPCPGFPGADPATRTAAPMELGALSAALQVGIARRLLAGEPGSVVDRQWLYDLPSGQGRVTRYEADPACRIDHAPWRITTLAGSVNMALGDALALAHTEAELAVPGMVFVTRLRCPAGHAIRRQAHRLSGRLRSRPCPVCGASLMASALDYEPRLSGRDSPPRLLREPLSGRGFVAGDIFALHGSGADAPTLYFQLA